MGLNRHFLTGFMLCLVVVGCAGFSYRYYGLDDVSYAKGNLLGPKIGDDLPFSRCEPNSQNKHPCVVMFTGEFYALKQDYEDVKARLIECEKGK